MYRISKSKENKQSGWGSSWNSFAVWHEKRGATLSYPPSLRPVMKCRQFEHRATHRSRRSQFATRVASSTSPKTFQPPPHTHTHTHTSDCIELRLPRKVEVEGEGGGSRRNIAQAVKENPTNLPLPLQTRKCTFQLEVRSSQQKAKGRIHKQKKQESSS